MIDKRKFNIKFFLLLVDIQKLVLIQIYLYKFLIKFIIKFINFNNFLLTIKKFFSFKNIIYYEF